MKKLRFKTKQELKKSEGMKHFSDVPTMDYLFGLPYPTDPDEMGLSFQPLYPRLAKDSDYWMIGKEMLTDAPHPYNSMDIKIMVTPEQFKVVMEKSSMLGFCCFNGMTPMKIAPTKLYLFFSKDGVIRQTDSAQAFNESKKIEVTYKQFMNGSVPKKKRKVIDKPEITDLNELISEIELAREKLNEVGVETYPAYDVRIVKKIW